MRVLDMCTEFASETAAFKARGHEVITLGIDGNVNIKCDIRQYYPSVDEKYDFIICHPPCTELSIANYRLGDCKNRNPDMSIVDACLRIIETLKPTYWMMENPRGCLRHKIGMPTITIKYGDYGHYSQKPTDLWGEFPWFWSSEIDTHIKGFAGWSPYSSGTRKPQERALIPYGLSLAICKAIENDMKT